MRIIFIIIAIFINIQLYAHQIDPYNFINDIIEKTKPALKQINNEYLEKTMEKYLDFNEIALWITGKTIWSNGSENEKLDFLKELKKLMLKTYSKTVYHYIDYDVEFVMQKNKEEKFYNQKRIQIYSIMKKNNKNVNISYRLIKTENSWLVFDIIIEGISILKSLKTQYYEVVKNKGIKYTTEKIKNLND